MITSEGKPSQVHSATKGTQTRSQETRSASSLFPLAATSDKEDKRAGLLASGHGAVALSPPDKEQPCLPTPSSSTRTSS